MIIMSVRMGAFVLEIRAAVHWEEDTMDAALMLLVRAAQTCVTVAPLVIPAPVVRVSARRVLCPLSPPCLQKTILSRSQNRTSTPFPWPN